MYYNTTGITDPKELERLRGQTNKQETYVLKIFLAHPDQGFCASEITDLMLERLQGDLEKMSLLSAIHRGIAVDKSVRRSITNLVRRHLMLIKTSEKRKGTAGKKNYVYKLTDLASFLYSQH